MAYSSSPSGILALHEKVAAVPVRGTLFPTPLPDEKLPAQSPLVTEIPQNVWLQFTDSSVKLKTDGVHRTSAGSASDQLSQTEKGLCLFYTRADLKLFS